MKRLSGYRLRLTDDKGLRHEAVVGLGEGYQYDFAHESLRIELTPLFKEDDGDDTRTLR